MMRDTWADVRGNDVGRISRIRCRIRSDGSWEDGGGMGQEVAGGWGNGTAAEIEVRELRT